MTDSSINLAAKFAKFEDQWAPRVIAALNDYQIKLVRVEGEFVWHSHPDTDELFLVLEGNLVIDFRDGMVDIGAEELFVVPKGVEHRPRAQHECLVMLIEPTGVVNTGDAGGGLTAANDIWI